MIALLVLGLLGQLGFHDPGSPPLTMDFGEFLDSWHDFYLMAGTAAVTLAGLMFVSLSFNLEHLVHASRVHLLRFARNTMLVYLMVLMVSLLMLVPHLPMAYAGVQLTIIGGMLALFSSIALWRLLGDPDKTFSWRNRLRRGLFPVLGGGLLLWTGVRVLRGEAGALYNVVPAVSLLLASALWSSWDLLVQVARARQERAAGER